MSDHPDAITSRPEIFPSDKDLLSDAELRLRARLATHCSTALPDAEKMKWVGHPDGNPHLYEHIGLINAFLALSCCGLRPEHHVLEPGCGPGRNARFLAPFLDPERGAFAGFDVSAPCIDWANESIAKRFPNARFVHANIKNTFYNPSGDILASEYQFPYEDQQFDVVFLPSVFTHMDQQGFERYVAEIHRVMKPGGRLLSWFFLKDKDLDKEQIEAITGHNLARFNDLWINTDNPDAFTLYETQYVLNALISAGFRPTARMRGNWAKQQATGIVADCQDKILSVRL